MNATIKFPPQKPTLAQLREREAKLEAEIQHAKAAISAFHSGLANLADELSELKKKIGTAALLHNAQP